MKDTDSVICPTCKRPVPYALSESHRKSCQKPKDDFDESIENIEYTLDPMLTRKLK